MNISQFIKNTIYYLDNKLYARHLSDINPNVIIPKSTIFHHRGIGVIMSNGTKLGNNVQIYQCVTLGNWKGNGSPTIGDDVTIHPYASVLGNVTIGRGTIIRAYSMFKDSFPPYSIVQGIPAKQVEVKDKVCLPSERCLKCFYWHDKKCIRSVCWTVDVPRFCHIIG